MNKLLIVGHPQSGYQDVERQLGAWGMQSAQPSRREGFSPEQVTQTLCKAHGAKPVRDLQSAKEVSQIEPTPLWQGVALDLLLGNMDQKFWGWADPQAVHLLNYWRDVDPELAFVLVYDAPRAALTRSVGDHGASLTNKALTEGFRSWVAYNEALLHFYNRNRQRCVLVHGQQVSEKPGEFLKLLCTYVDVPASPSTERLTKFGVNAIHRAVSGSAGVVVTTSAAPIPNDALFGYLADAIVRQDSVSVQRYEELQATADLPLAERAATEHAALEAWNVVMHGQRRLHEISSLLDTRLVQIESLGRQLADSQRQVTTLKQRGDTLETERQSLEAKWRESQAESELVLRQLHEVQEAYEQVSARRSQLEEDLASKHSEIKSLQSLADSKSSELAAALAAARTADQDSELKQENELLLAQLHQVQEELERYYLENERLKKAQSEAKPSNVVSLPVLYGAGDRVKQELPYRLGATMIARSKSLRGLLGMPWALRKEAKAYRSESLEKKSENLPPIEQYRDAYEADRVRRHLSYRLGNTVVTNSKTPIGWIRLPFAIRHEVRDFRRDRKAA